MNAKLLEDAFALAAQEEQALRQENIELAEECFEQRQKLLDAIWARRDSFDKLQLVEALSSMLQIQEQLTTLGESLKDRLQDILNTNKKQSQYVSGYRHQHAESRKSLYCSRLT